MKFSSKDIKFAASLKDCDGTDGEKGEKGVLVQAENITLKEYSDITTAIMAGLAHALRNGGVDESDVTMMLFGVLASAMKVGDPTSFSIEKTAKEN